MSGVEHSGQHAKVHFHSGPETDLFRDRLGYSPFQGFSLEKRISTVLETISMFLPCKDQPAVFGDLF